MRVLICRLSSLGDVACGIPAACHVQASFPEAHLAWAVDPRFADVVRCCPAVHEVIEVKPRLSPRTWPVFDMPFDAVLDLQGLGKSAIVAMRSKARIRLGYHWQREFASLATHPVIPDPASIHVVEQYIDVARALAMTLGRDPDGRDMDLPMLQPRAKDQESLRAKLAGLDVERAYCVLNPGAGWATKRWPAAHFGALADALWEFGVTPVAIGGNSPTDHAAYDEVVAASHHPPVKLTGQTSVGELIALLSGAWAHVGGDTGSSHLAAMLGIRSVGLYSITLPERSCPYRQADRCLYDSRGLDRISPKDVLDLLGVP